MMSNHLSFNFKLLKEEYKKYIWATALTFLVFLFSKIVYPILQYSSCLKEKNFNRLAPDYLAKKLESLNDYLTVEYDFNKVFVIILAIFTGTIIFSYLHSRKKVDFYHSLPISRNELFFLKYIVGIAIVVPIMIIMQFLLYGIFKILLGNEIISFNYVLESIGLDILFFITVYSFTVLGNILSGNSVIGVIITLVIINLISIILLLINGLSEILFGFDVNLNYIMEYSAKYNPLEYYLGVYSYKPINTITNINFSKINVLITYIVICIVLNFVSLLLFNVRKSEKSSTCLAFKYAKTIFKYLGVVIVSLTIGGIFITVSNAGFSLYLGIILSCIITHCIVEIIYDFDFKSIFKNWYSIIACILICIAIIFTFKFDIFKVKSYVPNIDKIESINIKFQADESRETYDITDKQIIEDVVKLHQIYVDEKNNKDEKNDTNLQGQLNIDYSLKNGKIVSRRILTYFEKENTVDLIKRIYNNKNYIEENTNEIRKNLKNSNKFEIKLFNNANDEISNGDNLKMFDNEKLLNALLKDVEQNGLYVLSDDTLFSIKVNYYKPYKNYTRIYTNKFYIDNRYTNTLNYLAQNNITPKDIKIEDVDYVINYNKLYSSDNNTDDIKITDREIIQKILDDCVVYNLLGVDYYSKPARMNIVMKNGNSQIVFISEKLYDEIAKEYNLPKFDTIFN